MQYSQKEVDVTGGIGPNVVTSVILQAVSDEIKEAKIGIISVFVKSPGGSVFLSDKNYEIPECGLKNSSMNLITSLLGREMSFPVVEGEMIIGEGNEIIFFRVDKNKTSYKLVATIKYSKTKGFQKQFKMKSRSKACDLCLSELVSPMSKKMKSMSEGLFYAFATSKYISLSMNENWDSDVRVDMYNSLDDICSKDKPTKTNLMGRTIVVPFKSGSLERGTWQGPYCCNFGSSSLENYVVTIIPKSSGYTKKTVIVRPPRRGIHRLESLNDDYKKMIANLKTGMIHFFIKHTSASLLLGVPGGNKEMKKDLNRVVKENCSYYRHTSEGSDDMPAHIKTSFFGSHLSVPVKDGKVNIGEEQEIMFGEYRDHPRSRKVIVVVEGI